MKHTLGIVGGMGVMASAEFTRTIYEYNTCEVEQEAPGVILLSDPTFPDRTRAFLSGAHAPLAAALERSLWRLSELGADRFLLACVTLHFTVPLLPARLRAGIISLVEVALAEVARTGRRQLLFCSNGARAARVFQNHPLWAEAGRHVVWPDEQDQELVHSLLYRYKVESESQPFMPHLDGLLSKYGVDSFVAGCSELHLLTKHLMRRRPDLPFIDPLHVIAGNLSAFLEASPHPGTSAALAAARRPVCNELPDLR